MNYAVKAFMQNNEDLILILKQKEGLWGLPDGKLKQIEGFWELPGGKVEKDESPLQAIKREVQEETGLEPDTITKIGKPYSVTSNGQLWEVIIYVCSTNETVVKLNPLEHSDYQWIDLNDIKSLKNNAVPEYQIDCYTSFLLNK